MNIIPYLPEPRNTSVQLPAEEVVHPVSALQQGRGGREDASTPSKHFVADVEAREKVLEDFHVPGPKAGLFTEHDEQVRKALDAYQRVAHHEERAYLSSVFNLDVYA